jgi:acyl dehydratase
MSDIDPDDVAVGDTKELVYENLEREDLVKYAGASGDFNPIHYSEPFAKKAGYDSVFGQGMYTAGLASNVVDDWFGIGSIKRFSTRFVGQTWPGDDIVARGEVADISENETATVLEIDIVAENGDGETLIDGGATVELTH